MSNSASLRSRTIVGLFWSGFGQFGAQGIHTLVILVLAALVTPAEFGLAGIALVYIRITQVFGSFNVTSAIVQEVEGTRKTWDTAFWTGLAVGLTMAALTYFGAAPIAGFMGAPAAEPLLKALSVIFPTMALGQVQQALLQRDLNFKSLSLREFAGEVTFGVVGIGTALAGAGTWSLVLAAIAQRISTVALVWVVVDWRPHFAFDREACKRLV